jgi:hypothetical protein
MFDFPLSRRSHPDNIEHKPGPTIRGEGWCSKGYLRYKNATKENSLVVFAFSPLRMQSRECFFVILFLPLSAWR